MDHRSQYRGKSVLVTGGAGAIGGRLALTLAEAGASVVILDDLSSSESWNLPAHPNIRFVLGDILDLAPRRDALDPRPAIVFHLAALFANQNSIDNKELDLMVNGMGTLRLLEDVRALPLERFVYASSGCSIYGPDAPLPVTEDRVSLHQNTPYQVTKMLGEMYCNFFYDHYRVPVVKARLFNSYGPGEIPGRYRNVIPNFIYWALKHQPLPITGTGEETRDFTYVTDIVDALLRAGVLPQAVGQEFNIASSTEVRIRDLAHAVNRLTANPAGIEFCPRRSWDKKSRLLASISRARQLLGYAPSVRFEEGLSLTVDWFRAHWHHLDAVPRFPASSTSSITASVSTS
jgi:UDP-glucose 4-epimerase